MAVKPGTGWCIYSNMPINILLVEDDPLVRDAAKRTLERNEVKVTAVCCIADAKEALSRYHFVAVVSDVRMPNGTGVDLHKWVIDQCPYLLGRFFFCSGGMPSDLGVYIDRSGCRLFRKPIDWNALVEALHELRSPTSPKLVAPDGASTRGT